MLYEVITFGMLLIDLPFFGANTLKLLAGGWLPLTIGCLMFTVMATWKWERFLLLRQMSRSSMPLETFIAQLARITSYNVCYTKLLRPG